MSDHPLEAVWDAVTSATDEADDSQGRINYDEGQPGLGWMQLEFGGEWYEVEVRKSD